MMEQSTPTPLGPGGDATNPGTPGGDTPPSEGGRKDGELENVATEEELDGEKNKPVEEAERQKVGEEGDRDQSPNSSEADPEASIAEDEQEKEPPPAPPQDESKGEIKGAASVHALSGRDLTHLSRPERSTLYDEGVRLQAIGKADEALRCLLGAITGLSESTTFAELPKCLHAVADIYFDKREYEKAVYFIQAEKMYYETALIDIANVPKQTGEKEQRRKSSESGDVAENGDDEEPGEESKVDDLGEVKEDDLSPDAKKGQEFENLARLCLKEGKLQLALEYCGKATKMYQSVYGEEHPVTVAALDLFTVIYADVGKKLYSDAMQKFEKEEEVLAAERSHDLASQSPDTELRHRGKNNNREMDPDNSTTNTQTTADSPHPHHGELEPASETERDDWVMTILLMLIFFLVTVFVAVAISSVYCYNNAKSRYCAQTRGDINYWYMYARHLIHDIRKSFR